MSRAEQAPNRVLPPVIIAMLSSIPLRCISRVHACMGLNGLSPYKNKKEQPLVSKLPTGDCVYFCMARSKII